ncbi:MAG: hypothetical protein AAF621_01545 [Pseudomonadota bacterium]
MQIIGFLLFIAVIAGGIYGGAYLNKLEQDEIKREESKDFVEKQFYYSKFEKPLIIPIFDEGKASAMLIAEIWLELKDASSLQVSMKRPRLRDEFLQVFSYYSSEGKLNEDILTPRVQAEIRRDLTRVGQKLVGDTLHAVLINDLQRQDL